MSNEYADRLLHSSFAERTVSDRDRDDARPLQAAIDRATTALITVSAHVDELYKRLDHLILHAPEPQQPETVSLARAASSDTVRLVDNIEESALSLSERLRRLLSILEA